MSPEPVNPAMLVESGAAVIEDVVAEDVLVEDVSIDGMCGVY